MSVRSTVAAAGERVDAANDWLQCRRPVRALLVLLLLVPAAVLLVLLLYTVAQRLTFPLALDWLEGSQIHQAYRLLQGQPLYRVADSGFLPHPYPPVQPALVAAAGALFGLDYLPARAVSVIAFALAATVVLRQVWLHCAASSSRPALVLVAAACVAATYSMVTGWYDTARIDSVALAFVVLSAAPLAGDRLRWWQVVTAAVLASVAVYTKQTAAFFAVALSVHVALRDLKKGVVMAAIMGLLCTAALVILERLTHGGFTFWLFSTRHHPFRPGALLTGALRIVTLAPFVALLPLLIRRRLSPRAKLWVWMLVAAVPAGVLPFAKKGGSVNNLIPVLFLAGPVTLIVLGDLTRDTRAARRITALVLVFQAVYLPFFLFNPGRACPGEAGRRRAELLNREVAALKGGVVCPAYPMLALRNGHATSQAGWNSHTDAMYARVPGVTPASYARWLLRVRPRWLLLSGDGDEADLLRAVGQSYVFDRELPAPRWDGLWQPNPLPGRLYRLAGAVR